MPRSIFAEYLQDLELSRQLLKNLSPFFVFFVHLLVFSSLLNGIVKIYDNLKIVSFRNEVFMVTG